MIWLIGSWCCSLHLLINYHVIQCHISTRLPFHFRVSGTDPALLSCQIHTCLSSTKSVLTTWWAMSKMGKKWISQNQWRRIIQQYPSTNPTTLTPTYHSHTTKVWVCNTFSSCNANQLRFYQIKLKLCFCGPCLCRVEKRLYLFVSYFFQNHLFRCLFWIPAGTFNRDLYTPVSRAMIHFLLLVTKDVPRSF